MIRLPPKMNQDEPQRKVFAFVEFPRALARREFHQRHCGGRLPVPRVPLTCPGAQPNMPLPILFYPYGWGNYFREDIVSDWQYCQVNKEEELAQLYFFSMKKTQVGGGVYFRITIKEFAAPPAGMSARFFAEADKSVNQKIAPVVPFGFGESLRGALSECMKMIRQFPYEGEDRV
jgi:hypothetical protein